jgi:hypothetical protein
MWNDRFTAGLWGRATFKNIFGGSSGPAPVAPTPTPPPTMPDPFNNDAADAARKKATEDAQKYGRAGTTLTTSRGAAGTIAGSAKLGAS